MDESEKDLWLCQQDIIEYKAVTMMNIDVCIFIHLIDAVIQRNSKWLLSYFSQWSFTKAQQPVDISLEKNNLSSL